jgi:hypothetical protein
MATPKMGYLTGSVSCASNDAVNGAILYAGNKSLDPRG